MTVHKYQRVLLVDSRPDFRQQLVRCLAQEGMVADLAANAREMFMLWDYQRYDLIFLGELTDESNLVVLRKLRQRDQLLVIVQEDLEQDKHRLAALEMGANDVVDANASCMEILLRMRNLLNLCLRLQSRSDKTTQKIWSFGNWTLEEGRRVLKNNKGKELLLTRAEFDLLLALLKADSKPLSKMQLSDAVGRGNLDTSPETIAVLIHRLRKKLGCKQVIQTLSGVGYRVPECELAIQ
ncbi:two-component system, OmpR family, response regulator [Marinospirillum celere]|uniref:Two-component system, OmpR family, response regulator n=1 Tax=Marinospirillum celere TaxID=1122252 RepID=A0A1I1G4E4_9GAMM|nr:response regulator transcription factor [Marinospirillum celere]SFC06146.1 two-component system, OmpR family, response regulator [Marinospirillum celere]